MDRPIDTSSISSPPFIPGPAWVRNGLSEPFLHTRKGACSTVL